MSPPIVHVDVVHQSRKSRETVDRRKPTRVPPYQKHSPEKQPLCLSELYTPSSLPCDIVKSQSQGMSSTRSFINTDSAVYNQRLSLPSVHVGLKKSLKTIDIVKSLEDYGALDIHISELPQSRHKIHPIFHEARWADFSKLPDSATPGETTSPIKTNEAWLNLQPVFRLATRFLTEQWCFNKFWKHLIRGQGPQLGSDDSQPNNLSDNASVSGTTLNEKADSIEAFETYLSYLDILAQLTSFSFTTLDYDRAVSQTRLVTKRSSRRGVVVSKKAELGASSSGNKILQPVSSSLYPTPSPDVAMSRRMAVMRSSASSKMKFSIPSFQRRIESFTILLPPTTFTCLDSLTALPRAHRLRVQYALAVALVSEIAEALGKLLALPNSPIMTGPDTITDSISSCPGVAFQRAILGGMLMEQSFVPAYWRAGSREDDLPEQGWAEDCAAGLVLDKGVYTAGKPTGVPYQDAEKRQVGDATGMVLLKSEWVRSWFEDEKWEMLGWGKINFYDGQYARKTKFWKARSGGKWRSLRGFIVFPSMEV